MTWVLGRASTPEVPRDTPRRALCKGFAEIDGTVVVANLGNLSTLVTAVAFRERIHVAVAVDAAVHAKNRSEGFESIDRFLGLVFT